MTRSWLRRRLASAGPADAGSAIVEFLGVSLVLLVPTVYLVLVLGALQRAAFAVDGAAREAVRAWTTTSAHAQAADDGDDDAPGAPGDPPGAAETGDPAARALAAVGIALADQGLPSPTPQTLSMTCAPDCRTPGSRLTATVEVEVTLPGVPAWLADVVPLVVPVSASATSSLDAFGGDR